MGNFKKYYTIYEIKNIKNGKIYIGMHETDDLEDGYLGSGTRLKRAKRYYGKEFFEKRILYIFDNKEDMVAKEIELVTEEFVNRKDTYNLKTGGKGGLCSKEHINILKNNLKQGNITFKKKIKEDKNFLDKYREYNKNRSSYGGKASNGFNGYNHTEDSKLKMKETIKTRQSQVGIKNSQYNTCWINNKDIDKKIPKSELNNYLKNGWVKGRKIKKTL
jgi:hypothetical protein